MIAYTLSEYLGQSAILTLLTVGVLNSHYTWFNLSPQGKHVSSVTFQTFSYIAEAVIFQFIGFTLIYYRDYKWSWGLVLAELFIIPLGRFIGTVGLMYSLNLCKHKTKLSFRQLCFICYAGLIRGAIAFGLVLEVTHNMIAEY